MQTHQPPDTPQLASTTLTIRLRCGAAAFTVEPELTLLDLLCERASLAGLQNGRDRGRRGLRRFNPLGARGMGESGITAVAAAIPKAVHQATGVRVRDLRSVPEKLLSGLPAGV